VIERAMDRYRAKKEKEGLEEELKKSNKELQEMYEIKSSFTSMVSHELRTPLTAIKEGIAIVLDGSAGEINGQQKEFLDMARKNVERLKRLIDDVLDFSKLESKKMELKMSQADINELIREIAEPQKMVAQEKGLYVKAEICPEVPPIEFDRDRIAQVLNNLISNAIKFTESGGVTVSEVLGTQENTITVCVKDTGEGIKKEDLPKLFQKFQQLEGAHGRKSGGTGLGLAICKQIIEQHGGRIWVESEFGLGTAVKFTLPLKRNYKVLIIDDEQVVLDACGLILEKSGFAVIRSKEGLEGIKEAQAQKPDSIVLDMRLGDINGYEVIGRLRSNKETAHIPILAISGYEEELGKIKASEGELALPWISKPFNSEDFIAKVEALVKKLPKQATQERI